LQPSTLRTVRNAILTLGGNDPSENRLSGHRMNGFRECGGQSGHNAFWDYFRVGGGSPAIMPSRDAIQGSLPGLLDEHRILSGMAASPDSPGNLPKRLNPTVVAFVAGLNLALFLIGTTCAWAALSIAKSLGSRFLLLLAGGWCLAIPCVFIWVKFRRRWRTGSWLMSEQERREARARLGIAHDARLMQDKER
jgi:hypothetical protein